MSNHMYEYTCTTFCISYKLKMFSIWQKQLVKQVLQSCLGMICLPCLGTRPSDEKYIYTLQQNISIPAISMVSSPHVMGWDRPFSCWCSFVLQKEDIKLLHHLSGCPCVCESVCVVVLGCPEFRLGCITSKCLELLQIIISQLMCLVHNPCLSKVKVTEHLKFPLFVCSVGFVNVIWHKFCNFIVNKSFTMPFSVKQERKKKETTKGSYLK